jgi:hypothetical protein
MDDIVVGPLFVAVGMLREADKLVPMSGSWLVLGQSSDVGSELPEH